MAQHPDRRPVVRIREKLNPLHGHCATQLQVVEIFPIYTVDSLSVSGFVYFQQVLWLLASVLYSSDEYPLQGAVGILERKKCEEKRVTLAKHLQVPTLLKPLK